MKLSALVVVIWAAASTHRALEAEQDNFVAPVELVGFPPAAVKEICDTFRKNVQYITPHNLNGTVTLLKDLGHSQEAAEALLQTWYSS